MMTAAIKKKFNKLFKARREIQENITLSGEHNSDQYNFVDIAMKIE